MPTKPLSHSQRLRAQRLLPRDRTYDQTTRRQDPALWRAAQIRSSGRWRKVRAMKLAQQPWCEDPYQRHGTETVTATECDHIEGLRYRPDLAYTLENLQSLCSACHARKSAGERSAIR